jgi:gas vesicle protein
MTNSNKIILGLVGAAAVGIAIGILLAPEKGSDARKKIAETANDIASRVGEWVNTGKDKVEDLANTVGQKANQAVDKAEKVQERMS